MKKKQTEYTTDNGQIHVDKVLDAMAKGMRVVYGMRLGLRS